MISRIVSSVLVASMVGGCKTSMREIDLKLGNSQPSAFKQGYRDGCDSGYVAAGHPYYHFSKDVMRFDSDSIYKQGWNDGFNVCKGEYESVSRSMH